MPATIAAAVAAFQVVPLAENIKAVFERVIDMFDYGPGVFILTGKREHLRMIF